MVCQCVAVTDVQVTLLCERRMLIGFCAGDAALLELLLLLAAAVAVALPTDREDESAGCFRSARTLFPLPAPLDTLDLALPLSERTPCAAEVEDIDSIAMLQLTAGKEAAPLVQRKTITNRKGRPAYRIAAACHKSHALPNNGQWPAQSKAFQQRSRD
eukprot:scpid43060/ scgid31532/ 